MTEGAVVFEARRPTSLGRRVAALIAIVGVAAGALAYSWMVGGDGPLDPYPLLSRFIGLAAGARALVALSDLVPALRWLLARASWKLELTEQTLRLVGPGVDRALPLTDIAAVVETPQDGVWLLLRGREPVALPPIFGQDEGDLAERLMRALPNPAPQREAPDAPQGLPSLRYDEAARGRAAPGTLALRQGRRWLRRGPYAAPLFALALGSELLRAPGGFSVGPVFGGLLALCLLAPLLWWRTVWRGMAPRKGVALLLEPGEVLLRTRAGVVRTSYDALGPARLERRAGWTLLEGSRAQTKLVLEREGEPPIRFDAAFFEWPAEVAAAAIDAYRVGRLP